MTTTPRIAPLPPQRAGLLTRLMYRYAKREFGEVPEPFTVAAHHPRLLVANAVHETLLKSGSRTLPDAVRDLAVLWTARTVGCSWCVDFGTMLMRLESLDTERLKHIDEYATSPLFTDDERAAIAYADAMTTDPHNVTDEQVDALYTAMRDGLRAAVDRSVGQGTGTLKAEKKAMMAVHGRAGEQCPVCGDVDLLVVPNIAAGNILLKALRYSAGASSAGIVVGGKVPIVLTSRAAEVEAKFLPLVLAASATF